MAANCPQSLDFVAIRVSKLNANGSPLSGASNGLVSYAPIKLDLDFDLKKGDDLEQINGQGLICAAFQQEDLLKRVTLSLDLCQLDAELMEILCGYSVFFSGANPIGAQAPAVGATPGNINGVCFEGWTKAWDGGSPAIPALTSPNAAYIHWVFPKATFWPAKQTLQHGFLTVAVAGKGDENPKVTGNGPFDDWPTPIINAGGVTKCYGWFFDANIPANTCGYVAVTSAAS